MSEPTPLPPWATRLLILLFFLTVVPLAIYGLSKQFYNGSVRTPQLQEELIDPYLLALGERDWSAMLEARTAAARARLTEEDLQAGYAQNIAPLGVPEKMEISRLTEGHRSDLGQYWEATIQYQGSEGERVFGLILCPSEQRHHRTSRWGRSPAATSESLR